MNIFKGERVFLKGASGSGKSTIFQLLLDGLQPTNGDIEIFGRSNEDMRGHIFLVDQRTNLFNESVLRNIRYGNDFVEEEEIEKPLSASMACQYRALSARANYLAAGRTDIMYAVKYLRVCMMDHTAFLFLSMSSKL